MNKSKDLFLKKFKKIIDIFNKIAVWISLIYVLMVTVLVLTGVVFRYFGNALSWTEELARWFIIGIAFVGASVALNEGKHVGITIIIKNFPDWLKKISILLGHILILIFLSYSFWYGIKAAMASINQTGGIINISMVYVKMQLPLGAGFMIINMLYYITGTILSENPEQYLLTNSSTACEVVEK